MKITRTVTNSGDSLSYVHFKLITHKEYTATINPQSFSITSVEYRRITGFPNFLNFMTGNEINIETVVAERLGDLEYGDNAVYFITRESHYLH